MRRNWYPRRKTRKIVDRKKLQIFPSLKNLPPVVGLMLISLYLSPNFFMESGYQPTTTDILEPQRPKELPGMLNVLTILTFIGCGFGYLGAIYSFITGSDIEGQRAKLEAAQEKAGDNEFAQKIMEGSLEMAQKAYDNRYILLLSGLLFTTLCLVGAMQMRKLKKSGYLLYVIGELAPVIVGIAVMGFSLMGGIAMGLGLVIAIIFVILYSTQRKYLVNP
jgi:hypothetical protein